jgi:hypothetical protein
MKNVMSKYLILKNNGRMYVYKSLSRVAKCRLLIIGIVFCLALSICCDGHVEGLRPKHVVVLYTIGRGGGLSLNKKNFVSFIGDGEICDAVRLPVRKIVENSVP